MSETFRKTGWTEFVGRSGLGRSPVEYFARDIQRTVRQFNIYDWQSRQQCVLDFLGYTQSAAGGSGQLFVSRTIPFSHGAYAINSLYAESYLSGLPFLYCQDLKFEGIGVPPGKNMKLFGNVSVGYTNAAFAGYNLARCTSTFSSLDYDILSDADMVTQRFIDGNGNPDEASLTRYVVKEYKPAATYLNVPAGTMYFVAPSNTNLDKKEVSSQQQYPGKIVPKIDLRLVWKELPANVVGSFLINPSIPTKPGPIHTLLGKVNCTQFPPTGPWMGAFPPGSLLFNAVAIKPYKAPLGGKNYDVEYMFEFAPYLHNYVPAIVSTGAPPQFGWVEISTDKLSHPETGTPLTGVHIYDSGEFANLFRVPL